MLRFLWLALVFVTVSTFVTCLPTENVGDAERSILNSESPKTETDSRDIIKINDTTDETVRTIGSLEDGNKTDVALSFSSNSVSETSRTIATNIPSANPKSSTSSSILSATSNDTETTTENSIFKNDTYNLNRTHDEEGVRSYFLSKVMFWNDDFLSSIIAPVLVGLAAALLIITIIMCFKCFKTSLTNRKKISKKRTLRGDIRKMKHIDRVKLLAASSDDEF